MKYLFFAMCIVCAISFSILAMIFKTGRVPGQPPPSPAASAAAKGDETSESLAVFSDSGKAVEELIAALKNDRAQYEKKMSELSEREEEIKLQESVLARLKGELKEMQTQLDENIARIAESEKTNYRRLAEVCGKMDAASAASSLLVMDKERAALILSLMNERLAAGILDATVAQGANGAKTVAEWTEIMRKIAKDNPKDKAKRGA